MKELLDLPRHSSGPFLRDQRLAISGEVRDPLALSYNDIWGLPTTRLLEDFRCLEGWVVKDVLWEGVRVSDVLRPGLLRRSARWVLFGSGDYTATLSLETALRSTTVLALKMRGRRLTKDQGGPYRLVFERHECYESVKCVDRIVALSRPIRGTARAIATSRIGS